MSLTWTQDGDDLVLNHLDRKYGGVTTEVLRVGDVDGTITAAFGTTGVDVSLPAGTLSAADLADGSVTAAKIGTGAVTAAKIGTGAVTTAKLGALAVDAAALGTGAVTTAKLGALAVDAAALATGAVTATKLGALAVGTAALAAAGVTFAKTLQFISTQQTGTGSAQNVAHGLGVAPTGQVLVAIEAGTDGSGSAGTQCPVVAQGTHTSTNVVLTVTSGAKFRVLAWG